MASISASGIGSNLDIESIVSQLMSVEQQPLIKLTQKEASYQSKLSAVGSLKSALSTFQTSVKALSSISKFQASKVSSSDAAVVSASGSADAAPGSYALEVTKLAQAQKLVTAGQASSSTAIGIGTLTFEFGTIDTGTGSFDSATGKYTGASFTPSGSGAKTVTIDSSNNSLTGIRDAINSAKIGVTAAIVNDGGTSPYRLVLTDSATGKENSMKISVAGDASLQALLNHDPAGAPAAQALTETVSAQNAEFKLDGLAISKSSNSVTDVIQGVTLNLAKTNAGATANITVSRDTNAVTTSVGQFVTAYNSLSQALANASAYNAETKQAAVLNGDATVRSIQTQMRGLLTTPIANGGAFTLLSQVGVSMQKDGTLAVDSSKLQKAMDSNYTDVAALFAASGKASDSLVKYSSASDKTTTGAYALNITQIATQATTTAASAAGLTIDSSNDTLEVKLDGTTATIKLQHATYASAAALASELQSQINGNSDFVAAGSSVSVTQTGGVLAITSARYGSGSNVSITGGNGQTNLIGASQSSVDGLDVVGTMNGVAATGSGQYLTGAKGTPMEGLKLQITGTNTGSRGTVDFSKGYAYQFDKLMDSLLGEDGAIAAKTDGLNATIKSIKDQEDRLQQRLVAIEARYRAQFTALDTAMSSMTNTSNFLTQQLAQLSANN